MTVSTVTPTAVVAAVESTSMAVSASTSSGSAYNGIISFYFQLAGQLKKLNLKVRQGRLELRKNFFSIRVVNSWNEIQTSIREVPRTETFQWKYKQLRSTR